MEVGGLRICCRRSRMGAMVLRQAWPGFPFSLWREGAVRGGAAAEGCYRVRLWSVVGSVWRINFSRVERCGALNWVL